MKTSELVSLAPCAVCEGPMTPTFWRVKLARFVVDPGAVQRRMGLEMMMGGGHAGAALAGIMGPDEDVAKPLGEERTVAVCENCAGKKTSVYDLGFEEESNHGR